MLTFNLCIPSDSGIKVPFPFDKVGCKKTYIKYKS